MLIDSFDLIGAHIDRLRYEVFQNLFLSPMNTDLLRHAVATAPTVYGIETIKVYLLIKAFIFKLQQHLPFTVLKLKFFHDIVSFINKLQQHLPFTVLKPTCLD